MIDASIPLGVQQYKAPDQMNMLAQILQIQGLQDARTKEQRALEQQTAMNDAYSGALGSDGNLDRNKLYSLLAGKGHGSQIPTAQKLYSDLDKTQSETDKNKATATKDTSETENKTIAMYRDASTAIIDPTSAVEFVKHMHSDPRLKDSAIARVPLEQALAQIPQDPQQLAAWKQQFALGASKFMEMNKPQFITSNTGGKTVTTGVAGLTGQTTPIQSLQNTQSPDNAATNATSRANNAATVGATLRGQNLVDARSREANSAGRVPAGYRQKADGSLEFIPGGPADPNAAKKAAPTEFQGKAGMFGTRAQEADRIISQLEGQYSPSGINTKQAMGHVPLVGGALEAGGNAMLSDASQKAEQAQRDFVNAVLRLESGAAIGKDEFDNARKQYFPQPNDRPEVRAQKAQNRKTAIQGLMSNARPGAGEQSGGATGSFAGPSVDDLLKKYGGK